jgi:hypothetical protein
MVFRLAPEENSVEINMEHLIQFLVVLALVLRAGAELIRAVKARRNK